MSITYYKSDLSEEQIDSAHVFVKIAESEEGVKRYFIKSSKGQFINPFDRTFPIEKNPKWVSVNEQSYNDYIKFLKTANKTWLVLSQRNM